MPDYGSDERHHGWCIVLAWTTSQDKGRARDGSVYITRTPVVIPVPYGGSETDRENWTYRESYPVIRGWCHCESFSPKLASNFVPTL